MNERIRKERTEKLKKTIQATINHLECGLATLEDANLYSFEDQEHDIDTFSTRLQDILNEMREMVSSI